MEETTKAIIEVKQEVQARDWAVLIAAQQASGLTVQKWCADNGSISRPIIIIYESSDKNA